MVNINDEAKLFIDTFNKLKPYDKMAVNTVIDILLALSPSVAIYQKIDEIVERMLKQSVKEGEEHEMQNKA